MDGSKAIKRIKAVLFKYDLTPEEIEALLTSARALEAQQNAPEQPEMCKVYPGLCCIYPIERCSECHRHKQERRNNGAYRSDYESD